MSNLDDITLNAHVFQLNSQNGSRAIRGVTFATVPGSADNAILDISHTVPSQKLKDERHMVSMTWSIPASGDDPAYSVRLYTVAVFPKWLGISARVNLFEAGGSAETPVNDMIDLLSTTGFMQDIVTQGFGG